MFLFLLLVIFVGVPTLIALVLHGVARRATPYSAVSSAPVLRVTALATTGIAVVVCAIEAVLVRHRWSGPNGCSTLHGSADAIVRLGLPFATVVLPAVIAGIYGGRSGEASQPFAWTIGIAAGIAALVMVVPELGCALGG